MKNPAEISRVTSYPCYLFVFQRVSRRVPSLPLARNPSPHSSVQNFNSQGLFGNLPEISHLSCTRKTFWAGCIPGKFSWNKHEKPKWKRFKKCTFDKESAELIVVFLSLCCYLFHACPMMQPAWLPLERPCRVADESCVNLMLGIVNSCQLPTLKIHQKKDLKGDRNQY